MERRRSISPLRRVSVSPPPPPSSAGAGAGAGAAAGSGTGAGAGSSSGPSKADADAAAAARAAGSGLDAAEAKTRMSELRPLQAPAPDVQLKEFGLMTLGFIVESLGDAFADDPAGMAPAMSEIADIVCGLDCKALFDDWAPPRGAYESEVVIKKENVDADASHTSNPAWHATEESGHTFWAPEVDGGRKSSRWNAALGGLINVTSIELKWHKDGSGKYWLPAKYEVQVSAVETPADESWAWLTVSAVEVPKTLNDAVTTHRVQLAGLGIRHVRIVSTGFCGGNPGSHHLCRVQVSQLDSAVHCDMQKTLDDLQALFGTKAFLSTPGVAEEAVRGLMGLMKASASLASLLQLVQCIITWPGAELPAAVHKYGASLVDELSLHVDESLENALSDNVDAMNERRSATFDPATMSSGMSLTEGNTRLNTGSGTSNKCCYVTPGIPSGKASWTFKVVYDKDGDQVLAFGCGIKPIRNRAYDSSPNLWTIRAYTGDVNNGGRSGSRTSKVNQGDEVRFELDHAAHTVELYINNSSKGVVFNSLPDAEIFPCVCSYGSDRIVELVNVRIEGNSVAGSVSLLDLDESDQGGAFEKEGKLQDGTRFSVDGKQGGRTSMSLVPTTTSDSFARYDLLQPAECLVGTVAIADGSSAAARPVVLEVRTDDHVVWTSPPMAKPGSSRFFRVFTDGAGSLELRARAVGAEGETGDAATLVVMFPRLLPARDWSWTPNGKKNAAVEDISTLKSPTGLVAAIASMAASLGAIALRGSGSEAPLEVPFCCQANGSTLALMDNILTMMVARVRDASSPTLAQDTVILTHLLQLLRLNLSRLSDSGVAPSAVGITLTAGPNKERSLAGIHKLLNEITHEDSTFPNEVQVAAATAVDAGLTLFYPSAEERQALLTSLIRAGGVVEVQFMFPTLRPLRADEDENTMEDRSDLRFERVLLMLQVECEAMGWRSQLEGAWESYSHLIIDIPQSERSAEFLDSGFARIFKKAGFPQWTFPTGCAEPNVSLVIQRFLNFRVGERAFTTPGVGVVRLYPTHAGSFEDVCTGVQGFLEAYNEKRALAAAGDAGETADAGA